MVTLTIVQMIVGLFVLTFYLIGLEGGQADHLTTTTAISILH